MLVIFARSGGAVLDDALATTSINKKFRKEAFTFLLVLLLVSRCLSNSIQTVGMAQRNHVLQVGYVEYVLLL